MEDERFHRPAREGQTQAGKRNRTLACSSTNAGHGDGVGGGGGVDGVAARCISWIKKVIYLAVSR